MEQNNGQANGNGFFLPLNINSTTGNSGDNLASGMPQTFTSESPLDPLPLHSLFQLLNPTAATTTSALEPDPLPPAPAPTALQTANNNTMSAVLQNPLLPDCTLNAAAAAGLLQQQPQDPTTQASFQQISASLLGTQLQPMTQQTGMLHQQHAPPRPLGLPPAAVPQQTVVPMTTTNNNNNNKTPPTRRVVGERAKFLLFIKILLKRLAQDDRLRQRVKLIVSECTRRNRMGDANYSPLQEAVELRLRRVVGDDVMIRARQVVDHYCQRNSNNNSNYGVTAVASV